MTDPPDTLTARHHPSGLRQLHVAGYRSIRDLRLSLDRINVFVGPNGCGKTNLYRALRLLAAAAGGGLAQAFAEEGGMPSALWAGDRTRGPVQIRLEIVTPELGYRLVSGLPIAHASAFDLDPEVKEEAVWCLEGRKRIPVLERDQGGGWARDVDGRRVSYRLEFGESESALSQLREPHRFPHLSALRQELLGWRFYHEFRTDPRSAIRQPQTGVRTTVLGHDGRDLAAALQTLLEIGDAHGLRRNVDRAFPGAVLEVETAGARFAVSLRMPGFRRAFDARELSDGTLRYLCLVAALMSPRPPAMLALNEPETSIHPNLLEPLASLLVEAARHTQVCVTTHSEVLAAEIGRLSGTPPVELEKRNGETRVAGQRLSPDDEDE